MKNLKNILLGAAGALVLLFAIGLFLADDETETTADTDPSVTSAEDFYGDNGNAADASASSGSSNADGKVIHLSAAQFKRLVADYGSGNKNTYIGNGPCVVDFFAEWCGPCKQLSPLLDKMAKKYAGRVTFYKVDIDEAAEVSNAYGIESIPTLFFCSDGQIESVTGAPGEEELDGKISGL